MTKEEIIHEYATHVGNGECLFDYHQALSALEYHAKQQSIAFDVWKRENCITYDCENNSYSKLIFLDVDHTKVRTEQLSIDDTYSQFIEQQNKP